jgi:prepilin-type N-terminal cleavage/methylation domain-containing protein
MRNAAHVSFRRAAFSLVELLIVVGIIAVLLAIVVPVMSKARNSARLVACQADVRQLIQASISYASDNEGVLPLPNFKPQDSATTPGWLYSATPKSSPPATPPIQTGLLWKYLNNPDVYHCPMDPGPWNPLNVTQPLTSYLMNPYVDNKGANPSSYALRRMNPRAILFLEGDESGGASGQSWQDGAAQLDKSIATRHGNIGASIGCFDGHTETISAGDYKTEQTQLQQDLLRTAPPKGRLYCVPP